MTSLCIEIFGSEKELSQRQLHLLRVDLPVAVGNTRLGEASKNTRCFYFATAPSHNEIYADISGARHHLTPNEYRELIAVVGEELRKMFPSIVVRCNLDAHTEGIYEWPVVNGD